MKFWQKSLIRIPGKVIIGLLLFFLFNTGFTGSQFIDEETSGNNVFQSAVLDLTLRSGQDNFSSEADVNHLLPGEAASREIYLGKTSFSAASLKHKVSYQYAGGDESLCNLLELKVWYNFYTCDPGLGDSCLDQRLKYEGSLTGLSDLTSDDFIIPSADQFDSDPSDGLEQWFSYEIGFPEGAGEEYQDLTCRFDLSFFAWQEESDGSWGFTDEEVLTGSQVGSGDWTAPGVPTGLTIYKGHDSVTWEEVGCGGHTNDTQITIDWADNPESDLDYYWFGTQFNPKHKKVLASQSFYKGNMTPGYNPYYYTVMAVDKSGNESEPSSLCYLTLDNSAPVTSLITANSPARLIQEDVLNGDFNKGGEGLEGWDYEGEVEVVEEEDFDTDYDGINDLVIDPDDIPEAEDNEYMVVIRPSLEVSGSSDEEDLYYSMLSQEISNSAKTLSFWFNFVTEDSVGFDNPGFSVYINDQEVYQLWAEDINADAEALASSGWQKFYYDISSLDMDENPILTLVFYAGNKGDDMFDSWVYLDKISTLDTVVNGDSKLYLENLGGVTPEKTYFKLGSCDSEVVKQEYTYGSYPEGGFSLTERTLDDRFCFWSEDEAGNEEEEQEIILIYDNDKPDAVTDLEAVDFGSGEFGLSWTAVDPNDEATGNNTAAGYLVKFSTAPIEDEVDFALAQATSSGAPRQAGTEEYLDIKGLNSVTSYYFAIKAVDAVGNQSDLDPAGGSVAGNGSLVVLNEIMYNPEFETGNMPEGEWVELYNNADYDIDVEGWQIRDDDGDVINISQANSDNNGDLDDGGETVVPSLGWLTVYRNGGYMFSNSGDTVELYNLEDILVDSHTYIGGKDDDSTESRVPDGVGPWVDPLPTPGRKNVINQVDLEPQIKIWQQDDNNAKIGIFDAVNYDKALCEITYYHQEEGVLEAVPEGLETTIMITDQDIYVRGLYLGTESNGVYNPHHNISAVDLSCTFTGTGIPDRSLNVSLGETWDQE